MLLLKSIHPKLGNQKILSIVYNNLLIGGKTSNTGNPQFDTDYIVFTNGTYDLKNKTFGPWSPEYFVTFSSGYEYDPKAECPEILKFLKTLLGGYQDRIEFNRAWLLAVVYGIRTTGMFLYMYGPGGTGKSVFAHLAAALVGSARVVTTSLKQLNNDPFEVGNLVGKKLISIGDAPYYRGETAVLKQVSGNDTLMGRFKYVQGSFEIQVTGLVLIVSNFPLGTLDTSGALNRRMRVIPAENIVPDEEMNEGLLDKSINGGFQGSLVKELPGLFNWVITYPKEKVLSILKQRFLPSTKEFAQSASEELNPLLRWAKSEVEKGEGSYFGFKLKPGIQGENEFQTRKPLYPAYDRWSRREGIKPLSQRMFANSIMEVFKTLGFNVKKERKNIGTYIHGVQLKKEVFNRDYMFGAPIEMGKEMVLHKNTKEEFPTNNSSFNCFTGDELYAKYFQLLGKNPMKENLNLVSKKLDYNLEELTNSYCQSCTIKSEAYYQGVYTVMEKGLKKMKTNGAIPFEYKLMGVSPRIIPTQYKDSIQNVKKHLRNRIYTDLSLYSNQKYGFVFLDLDLKACYISILLGLYPSELTIVQQAMDGEGIWNYILKEFQSAGKGHKYDKALAKICVYASLFQGGNKAMMDGILEHFRKNVGLSTKEFRDSKVHQEAYLVAQETTYFMNNSAIINSFRVLSDRVRKNNDGGYLEGPTGHKYPVNDSTFRSSFPSFLQSYEFYLLANAVLQLKSTINLELIGHYHDRVVVAIPQDSINEFEVKFSNSLEDIRTKIDLHYPIRIEITNF